MKQDEISHTGRIVSIDPMVTKVEIIRSSACGECHARALCGYAEDQVKIVDVPTNAFDFFEVGQQVQVCLKRSMGMKAVWISYVIPLIVMMIVILLLNALGAGELATGLAGIGAVALYYIALFIAKRIPALYAKLFDEYVFYIK